MKQVLAIANLTGMRERGKSSRRKRYAFNPKPQKKPGKRECFNFFSNVDYVRAELNRRGNGTSTHIVLSTC